MYDKKDFTWGYEIEWGDIDRRLEIPSHLGSWEYSETDVVNLRDPYRYVACDPLGEDPPFGGEVNTKPTKTWEGQVDRIQEIKQWFIDQGCEPTSNCLSHSHLHVYVPKLTEDLDALKRLIKYIKDNQADVVENCGLFHESGSMKKAKGAKMYMKYDGGRQMPEYMANNIINLATDFDHFIKLHAAGKDGVSMGRPFRYAINTYCMKHTGTIEFRCFRATTERKHMESMFRFVEAFIDAALNGGPSVKEILSEGDYEFPPFDWNLNQWVGHQKTKWAKERGTKKREYYEVA